MLSQSCSISSPERWNHNSISVAFNPFNLNTKVGITIMDYYEWNHEPLKLWPIVVYAIPLMCHKTLQSNSTTQENKTYHTLTCSFQTCLITERVASFQHKDDLSSAISFSAGSLALAADLLKVWVYVRLLWTFILYINVAVTHDKSIDLELSKTWNDCFNFSMKHNQNYAFIHPSPLLHITSFLPSPSFIYNDKFEISKLNLFMQQGFH